MAKQVSFMGWNSEVPYCVGAHRMNKVPRNCSLHYRIPIKEIHSIICGTNISLWM